MVEKNLENRVAAKTVSIDVKGSDDVPGKKFLAKIPPRVTKQDDTDSATPKDDSVISPLAALIDSGSVTSVDSWTCWSREVVSPGFAR